MDEKSEIYKQLNLTPEGKLEHRAFIVWTKDYELKSKSSEEPSVSQDVFDFFFDQPLIGVWKGEDL